MVGADKMRVSWVTQESAPSTVDYGTSSGVYQSHATGNSTSYRYLLYHSGEIHEVVIGPLKPNTLYYYRCSGDSSREFSFKTTPTHLPIKFAVVGLYFSRLQLILLMTGGSTFQIVEKVTLVFSRPILFACYSFLDVSKCLHTFCFCKMTEPFSFYNPHSSKIRVN